jgi:hypothetical protein
MCVDECEREKKIATEPLEDISCGAACVSGLCFVHLLLRYCCLSWHVEQDIHINKTEEEWMEYFWEDSRV